MKYYNTNFGMLTSEQCKAKMAKGEKIEYKKPTFHIAKKTIRKTLTGFLSPERARV